MESSNMKYIIAICSLCLLWMMSNDPSFQLGHSNCESLSFSPLLPPTREELEQAAHILASAMKREDDYQTFINKLLHSNDEVRDQQNYGRIEQDNKIGFITPSKVIEFDGFRCDLRIRQPSRMLPSKVGNLATFVVFQVRFTHFSFPLQ
jgi:hypothetical protein